MPICHVPSLYVTLARLRPCPPAAAGFADGLGRGATLVVGDLSFLHDINGLNLLRSGGWPGKECIRLSNKGSWGACWLLLC